MTLFHKYLRNRKGAVAVEAAIAIPMVIFILLAAVDFGIQINSQQNMNKAVKSGMQYVIHGGRKEAEIKDVIALAAGKQVSANKIDVIGYCACITETSSGPAAEPGQEQEMTSIYVRTITPLADDMCPAPCSQEKPAIELVEIKYDDYVRGIYETKSLRATLQHRLK